MSDIDADCWCCCGFGDGDGGGGDGGGDGDGIGGCCGDFGDNSMFCLLIMTGNGYDDEVGSGGGRHANSNYKKGDKDNQEEK